MSGPHLSFVTSITRPASGRRAASRSVLIARSVDAVRRIMRVLRIAEQRTQLETGISTAQVLVLQQLEDGEALSLTELAERTSTDRSSVTDVVDRLVERGLAHRVRDRGDARRMAVSITRRGRALLRRAGRSPAAVLVAGLRGLNPAQLRAVGRSLDQLSEALDRQQG